MLTYLDPDDLGADTPLRPWPHSAEAPNAPPPLQNNACLKYTTSIAQQALRLDRAYLH